MMTNIKEVNVSMLLPGDLVSYSASHSSPVELFIGIVGSMYYVVRRNKIVAFPMANTLLLIK